MRDAQVLVYVDLAGCPVLAGRLWARVRRDKESASFEYDPRWLASPGRFSLELVDVLRRYGAAPSADMRALWRRIVFNILISNTDDHLRNHAFLYDGTDGWRLAPAYDLNPVPVDIKPRVLTTAIDLDDGRASLALARSVAEYFGLNDDEARTITREVGEAVSGWRREAARHGLTSSAIDRMASAFEHDDLMAATGAAKS